MRRTVLIPASFLLLNLGACILTDKQIGDDEASDDDQTGDGDDQTGDGDDQTGDGDPDPGDGDGDATDECSGPFSSPAVDQDCDGVGIACDNARDHHNPDQLDQDQDGFGDAIDLCPLVADETNTADSDKDGIGNACDRCRNTPDSYNEVFAAADPRMWVRNVPDNRDFDQDGIGDACDNCVVVANCLDYGPDNPAPNGAEAELGDPCQTDSDLDGIGDACIDSETNTPINGEFAAGPVGFGPNDDFDQDGLINFEDACPRLPLALDDRFQCAEDIDCNPGSPDRQCADTPSNAGQSFCNHRDSDFDGIGDECDTCPFSPNPMQVTDTGMLIDDEDRDFIGAACETTSACAERSDARPIRFYDVSVAGECCVTTYPGDDVIHDPDGVPIRVDCSSADEQANVCRKLPLSVAATLGVLELPSGCAAALIDAGVSEATALTLADVGNNALELWGHACRMPPLDQDFDGIGDACDLCMFGWDPYNTPYTDGDGMLWPNVGAACAGAYEPKQVPGALCQPD